MLTTEQRQAIQTTFTGVSEQVPLAKFSTFRIGGPARFLLGVSETVELVNAIRFCRSQRIPYALLGSGANTLIADRGYDGLVIIVQTSGLRFEGQRAIAEAGVKLPVLLVRAALKGLGGLDVLAGVPGTVGGAIFGNAGGRDVAIGNFVASVEVLDEHGSVKELPVRDCAFRYRMSRFKETREPILAATLTLVPGDSRAIQQRYQALIREKNIKQPTSSQSAGCIFKNVELDDPAAVHPALRKAVVGNQLSSWRVIDQAGLRGRRMGGVRISEVHANFMINDGSATADDVAMLISYVKQQVRDAFGIQLQEEVRYLGFDEDTNA